MSNPEIGLAGLGLLLVLIALRVPIGAALIGVSFGGIWVLVGERAAWGALKVIPYNFAASWHLSSVPMFLLMGFVCFHAGLTRGLFETARLWLSRLPGGLAIASIFGSAGFAAVTGSSVACAAAMGRIAVPEMMRARYDAGLATGTVAAAGTIGALIPPSILMILYGIIAKVPISALFVGGIGAGLLTAFAYVATIVLRVKRRPELAPKIDVEVTHAERMAALRGIAPVILLVVGVFGGLFSGLFTASEAGAVGAALALIIAVARRDLSRAALWNALTETLYTSAALFIIAIGASMLTRFVALSGAGKLIAAAIGGLVSDPILLLAGIALVYLVLGMFLEPIGAMLLTLPIFLPILEGAGIDLLWYGVLLAKFLEIGMITPPIGMNVFVIRSVAGEHASTGRIFAGVMPFLVADAVVVVLLIAFPSIILALPSLLS
ncbi:MAG: TRAP transporter large permease [Sagittula sp.]|uniref:TRAP transporter large permease n=1 Tax=Sagittula sp. TaxID=2038081 RepID=UPI0040593172